ncbi:Spliceosome-associated protein CWC15-like protein [Bienertia sinuspersici]
MTTAARPTWAPAKGGNEQGGTRIFGPSQKYSSRDLAAHTNLKPRRDGQDTQDELQKRDLREELEDRERRHFTSKDKSYGEDRDRRKGGHLLLEGSKREAEDRIIPRSVDADDSDVDERQQQEEELKTKEAELMRGNPLINNVSGPTNFNVKRRWDDDVVFKNQARGESKAAKRFINDTIRNDFHRKFLHKYMK